MAEHVRDAAEPEAAAPPQADAVAAPAAPARGHGTGCSCGRCAPVFSIGNVLALQRSAGNAVVARSLAGGRTLARVIDDRAFSAAREARDTWIAGGRRGPADHAPSTGRGGFEASYDPGDSISNLSWFGNAYKSGGGPRCGKCKKEIAEAAAGPVNVAICGEGPDRAASAQARFGVVKQQLIAAGMSDADARCRLSVIGAAGTNGTVRMGEGVAQIVAAHDLLHAEPAGEPAADAGITTWRLAVDGREHEIRLEHVPPDRVAGLEQLRVAVDLAIAMGVEGE